MIQKKKKRIFILLNLLFSSLLCFTRNDIFVKAKTLATADETVIDTYNKAGNYMIGKTGVYANINSLANLIEIKTSTKKPTSAILKVNTNMDVLDSDNNSIGLKIKDAYDLYLSNEVIPIVYINSNEEALAFVEYHKYEFNMIDMAVISPSIIALETIRNDRKSIRGILDYSNKSVNDKASWSKAVFDANSCFANSIILNENDATSEAIYYIQARFKTVLINQIEKTSMLDTIEQYTTGSYGIISNDYNNVYAAYKQFDGSPLNTKNLLRRPYSVAHRGECISTYENSMEGFIKSYEDGATHLELDLQVTKDNQLVIMHDDTLTRTTNYNDVAKTAGLTSSNISSYTLEELSQFKIITNYTGQVKGDGVAIPTLDEVFTYFKDKDIVIICELKSNDVNLCSLFKGYLNKYNIYNQVVCISFNTTHLNKMKTIIPEIPTADLNDYTFDTKNPGNFIITLSKLNSMNTTVDTNKAYISPSLVRYLAVRGFSAWFWTYPDVLNTQDAIRSGGLGITTNVAEGLTECALELYTSSNYFVSTKNDIKEEKMVFNYKSYGGLVEDKPLDALPIYVEDHNKYAKAIYCATYTSSKGTEYVIYSKPIIVIKGEFYVSEEEIKSILSKDNNDLSDTDIETLQKAKENIDVINMVSINQINVKDIDNKINEYENSKVPTNKGCNGSASSIVGLVMLLFTLLRKKKTI